MLSGGPGRTCLVMLMLLFSSYLFAQGPRDQGKPKPTTRILFVFDASQSMYGRWQSDTKFNIAVKLFSSILDSLRTQPNLELALRVYGHQKQFPPQDCNDTKLEVPLCEGQCAEDQACPEDHHAKRDHPDRLFTVAGHKGFPALRQLPGTSSYSSPTVLKNAAAIPVPYPSTFRKWGSC